MIRVTSWRICYNGPLKAMNPFFISTFSYRRDRIIWSGIDRLRSVCAGLIILDLGAPFPIDENIFTARETARAAGMGFQRRKAFIGARIALKMLARNLGLVEKDKSDGAIETLGADGIRPHLGDGGIYCSVSHSARFVAAAVDHVPVGIDIETVSNKAVRIGHLFLSSKENALVSLSPLGTERAATRVWTIKEAAAKVWGLHLFQAIQDVEVVKIGETEGWIHYQGEKYVVGHGEGDGQVITLLTGNVP